MRHEEIMVEPERLMSQLQSVLSGYLKENSRRTLNGLSKRCTVSEPTLRRILKGQVKTAPNVTTVLDVLTTVTGERSARKIAERFPGPIADYIRDMAIHLEDCDTDYDPNLNMELRNPTSYVIYKLASNRAGADEGVIQELFGAQGKMFLENLISKGYIELRNGRYHATSQNFSAGAAEFVANFKSVADFIKVRDVPTKTNMNPLLVNYSESVSAEAYREIVSLQKATLKKIRGILADPTSAGEIPLFMLMAVDTLDRRIAAEMDDATP